MHETEREAIRACRPTLVSNMDAPRVMDYLITGHIFDYEDEEVVAAKPTLSDKNRLILKLLTTTRNKENTFDVLIEGLKGANQPHLADMLLDRKAKVNQKRNSCTTNILNSFGIPSKPEVFVSREELAKKIKESVLNIPSDGGWVLIHGMGGNGKTVLASTALRDKEILDKFTSLIWLPLGKVDDEKLLLKFKILIQRLDPECGNLQSLTALEEAQNILRNCVKLNHSVLIVLDDVWDDVVKHFINSGGAFLVTSRESKALDRVAGVYKEKIEIKEGFTEGESEIIFSQMLNMKPQELPHEATEIRKACGGSPLAIVMIASLLKRYPERWKYYLKKLKEGPTRIKQRSNYAYDSLDAFVRASVESLDDTLKCQYLKLAAFPKGTPLYAEVLVVVWNVEEVEEAEDIIDELVSLSLAREERDKNLKKCYVIHDLQMAFLRYEDKNKESHKSLIENYRNRFGSWHCVPKDDRYFLWYIGHHLKEAGLCQEMVEIFTDLRFIQRKIQVTGAWDVINDYLRYDCQFKNHGKFEDMKHFSEFLYKNMFALSAAEENQVVDLIQLGLCDPPDRTVFIQAQSMARKQSDKPYWKWT